MLSQSGVPIIGLIVGNGNLSTILSIDDGILGGGDNTNVESITRSVVKYVINNIMITALTGQRKTATYLYLVRE